MNLRTALVLLMALVLPSAVHSEEESTDRDFIKKEADRLSCRLDQSLLKNSDMGNEPFLRSQDGKVLVAWCFMAEREATGETYDAAKLLIATRDDKHPFSSCPALPSAPFSYDSEIELLERINVKFPRLTLGILEPFPSSETYRVPPELMSSPADGPGIGLLGESAGSVLYCLDGRWFFFGFH